MTRRTPANRAASSTLTVAGHAGGMRIQRRFDTTGHRRQRGLMEHDIDAPDCLVHDRTVGYVALKEDERLSWTGQVGHKASCSDCPTRGPCPHVPTTLRPSGNR